MYDCDYDFHLVIRDEKGAVIHRGPVKDFLPCYEDLLFSGILSGSAPNDGAQPRARIEPVWRESAVAGITMSINGTAKSYGLEVFAIRVWEVLLAKDLLKECAEQDGKTIWHVEAQKREATPGRRRLSISVGRKPYPILERPLAEFGIERQTDSDHPLELYVSSEVVEQMRRDAAGSLDCERAAFLTGHLVREAGARPAVILKGRIPALADTTASKTHVSFSPLTFQAAQKELDSRANGAKILAWSHNHPPTCGRECLMIVPPCKTETVFFSPQDRVMHRASFPAPYMVALVAGKGSDRRADDPIVRAYGWRDAVIKEREFQIF